ncbi:hypothetical protein VE02_09739 [Pseudogymnoascus sp. 03VT05]|nr:hypothetical protein VE02_09739 [Pseudogymnoascus sp. 03VT05]
MINPPSVKAGEPELRRGAGRACAAAAGLDDPVFRAVGRVDLHESSGKTINYPLSKCYVSGVIVVHTSIVQGINPICYAAPQELTIGFPARDPRYMWHSRWAASETGI